MYRCICDNFAYFEVSVSWERYRLPCRVRLERGFACAVQYGLENLIKLGGKIGRKPLINSN